MSKINFNIVSRPIYIRSSFLIIMINVKVAKIDQKHCMHLARNVQAHKISHIWQHPYQIRCSTLKYRDGKKAHNKR